MLTARLALLTRRLADLGPGVPRFVVGDDGDHAVANEAYELELHARERMVQDAKNLSAALERLDDGTYGICEACRDRILPERLVAIPTATRCVRCQAAAEQRGDDEPRAFGVPREPERPLEEQ